MSRSYKHHPVYQDQGGKRFSKRYANRVVRRQKEVPGGKAYKKYYESWNISDYCFRTTWEEYLQSYWYNKEDGLYYFNRWWGNRQQGYTLEELYNNWAKVFLRK